jgi:hypothetical protein
MYICIVTKLVLNQEEINHLNRSIISNEIWAITKSFPT